jgi:formylglycine-generating enzyme required for sulfatase activity
MKRVFLFSVGLPMLITIVFLLVVRAAENRPPFVSNIYAQQRPGTKLVDIIYDVDDPDGDRLTITVAVSDDGGSTFKVPAWTLTGDVGNGISPGKGKKIVWNAGADLPNNVYSTNFRLKIIANDGQVGGTTIIGNDGALMMLIPAGEFEMGDSFNEGGAGERPVHLVYLDAFYIDVNEVTNAQYKKFMLATGHPAPLYWADPKFNAPDQPVVGVSWEDAQAYCKWAGKRLPTEAEWEKAARGGLLGNRYPWGNDISGDNANYEGTGGKDIWDRPAPVGSFAPNGYGLYDMVGNAWEWCADWYDSGYYAKSPKQNPKGPDSGGWRVLRGGSWTFNTSYLRCAYRSGDYAGPSTTHDFVGFRCSQDL